MCALFAATYPERTTALVLCGGFARRLRSADYDEGTPVEVYEDVCEEIADGWGGPVGHRLPSAEPRRTTRGSGQLGPYLRAGASPGAALALTRMNGEIDVRDVLPSIRRPDARPAPNGRPGDLGSSGTVDWPSASPVRAFVELPGDDHLPWVGDSDGSSSEIEEFLTGVRRDRRRRPRARHGAVHRHRRLDRAGGRDSATARGATCSRPTTRACVASSERFAGREVKTTGDGFLATFDGPARAIRCASAIARRRSRASASRSGPACTRARCELVDGDVRGIAVHIGARVAALAGAGEVLVSSTVKDLVAGSGLEFADRGEHVLKGVPGAWRVFALLPG